MITIKNLTKKFGDDVLFDKLNIHIEKGEMVALCGESGCGKTTLLNIIGLLDNDYSGELIVRDEIVRNSKSEYISKLIRNNIAYLFQNYALIDDKSIFYNLNLAFFEKISKSERERRMKQVMDSVGLSKNLNMSVYKLSGGEQQRLSIARALLLNRDIYLCDEPTGNLDKHNSDLVIDLLGAINRQGKTIVIVTHDQYIANRCSKIISLSRSE